MRRTKQCTGEPNQLYQLVFFFLWVPLPYSGSWPHDLPLRGITFTHKLPHTLDTPHSVGLLWTSYLPDAHTSTWQHTQSQETDIHFPGGIRTHNPSKRSAADPRLGCRGHLNRRCTNIYKTFNCNTMSRDVWVCCCWTISLLLAPCSSSSRTKDTSEIVLCTHNYPSIFIIIICVPI